MPWGCIAFVVCAVGVAAIVFEDPRGASVKEAVTWQKVIFVAWIIAGPLYLLWASDFTMDLEDYKTKMGWNADQLKNFQYRQKLLGDVWTAGSVMLGMLWGLKKGLAFLAYGGFVATERKDGRQAQ